jgi:GH15 family glucan-1,4-alpha-glucosidase
MALRIEDYALIGDCKTAALVGRDGSIDWLCWPRFDSAACFASMLGTADNGRWLIAPKDPPLAVRRQYRSGTLVLETEFETATGCAAIVDFMPPADGADLVRIVVGRSGRIVFQTELVLRFNYGAIVPWVNRLDDDTINAVAGPERVVLRTPVSLYGEDLRTVGEFTVEAGQSVPFALSYGASFQNLPAPIDPLNALARTEVFWRQWSDRCPEVGPWTEFGETLAHHIEGFDLRANGRNRRSCHDLASRAPGRCTELGLSLLLASGRHLHAARPHETRLLRRGAGMARLACAGCRRQPAPSPDHVRCRR